MQVTEREPSVRIHGDAEQQYCLRDRPRAPRVSATCVRALPQPASPPGARTRLLTRAEQLRVAGSQAVTCELRPNDNTTTIKRVALRCWRDGSGARASARVSRRRGLATCLAGGACRTWKKAASSVLKPTTSIAASASPTSSAGYSTLQCRYSRSCGTHVSAQQRAPQCDAMATCGGRRRHCGAVMCSAAARRRAEGCTRVRCAVPLRHTRTRARAVVAMPCRVLPPRLQVRSECMKEDCAPCRSWTAE